MIIPVLYLMMCLLNAAALIALFKITQNDNVEDPLRKKFVIFTVIIFLWFTVIGLLPVEDLGARCQPFTYKIPFCYLMQLVYQIYWVVIVRWWVKRQNLIELIDERLNAKHYEEEVKEEKDKENEEDKDKKDEEEEEDEDEDMGADLGD